MYGITLAHFQGCPFSRRDYTLSASLKVTEPVQGLILMSTVEPDQIVSSFSLIKDDEASGSCEIHAVHF